MSHPHNTPPASQVWLTPPGILEALGPFDLDPAAPASRPWEIAARHITETEDGLSSEWDGMVWLNPPYHRNGIPKWMERMAEHGRGFAMVFARTETVWFQRSVFGAADGVLFLAGRIRFHLRDGELAPNNCGASPVIAAYGPEALERLRLAVARGQLQGRLVML